MSTVYTKMPLSFSTNGKQILVASTNSSSATNIHSATGAVSSTDEIWLYASNNATSSISCSILWGGTSEPNDVVRTVIPSQAGRMLVVDGKLLQNALTIQAYAQASNLIIFDGFVNRITTDPIVDQRVSDWTRRVVNNGGSMPSTSTQLTLTTFIQTLTSTSLLDKMLMVNCVVPDNFTASATPLIRYVGYDAWVSHNFTGSDLTVNGLKGDGSSRYFDTGIVPSVNSTTTNTGFTMYISANANDATDVDFACDNNGSQILGLYTFAGSAIFDCYTTTVGSGRLSATATSFTGYISGNRGTLGGGLIDAIFTGSSALGHGILASSTTNTGGSVPTVNVSAFAFNANGSISNFSQKRISFFAYHKGLTTIESQTFYTAVQKLRNDLGGGFI